MMLDREAKNIWQLHVSTYNKQRLPECTAVDSPYPCCQALKTVTESQTSSSCVLCHN
jgi:hypothetical protein